MNRSCEQDKYKDDFLQNQSKACQHQPRHQAGKKKTLEVVMNPARSTTVV